MLALQLFIDDYHRFRDVNAETWNGYRYGVFDLVSSSLTTNTALDLARRTEEDVKPLFDKFGGPEKMLQLYFIGLCIDGGEDQHFTERPADQLNFRMYKQAYNIFYPPTYSCKRISPWSINSIVQSISPAITACRTLLATGRKSPRENSLGKTKFSWLNSCLKQRSFASPPVTSQVDSTRRMNSSGDCG